MGAKKDINRVRELIIGKDIERFEKKFSQIDDKIKLFLGYQRKFEERISLNILKLEEKLEKIEKNNKKIIHSFEKMDNKIENEIEHSSQQLKTIKAEVKMYVKNKVSNLEMQKISHEELSQMFAALSKELNEVDNINQNAR